MLTKQVRISGDFHLRSFLKAWMDSRVAKGDRL